MTSLALPRLLLALAVVIVGSSLHGEEAYREKLVTPHWRWLRTRHAGGTVRALVLVNNKARREPDELAQRFDIHCTTVPVAGDDYANRFDEEFLLQQLEQRPDILVMAAHSTWQHLSEGVQAAVRRRLQAGMPVLDFGRRRRDMAGGLFEGDGNDDAAAAVGPFPVDQIDFVGIGFKLRRWRHGKGRAYLAESYGTHFTAFNAFVPRAAAYPGNRPAVELAYALAARLIRHAAGRRSDVNLREVTAPATVAFGSPLTLTLRAAPPIPTGVNLAWTLYTPTGEKVGSGQAPVAAGLEAKASLLPPRGGKLVCVWRLEREGVTLDFGALSFSVKSPATIAAFETSAALTPDECRARWQTKGQVAAGDVVEIQVYDPLEQVVSLWRGPARAEGECKLPPWRATDVSHQVRCLLLRDGRVLDEQRRWLHLAPRQGDDQRRFQVIAWATERGAEVERWRYERLRELGVGTIGVIGPRPERWQMVSAAGLRLAPTNVYVPAALGRYKNKPPEEARRLVDERLAGLAKGTAAYHPLGYSLADEPKVQDLPKGQDLVAWRDAGAEIIRRHDKDARVGYCGFWPNTGGDLARLLRAIDFAEGYSPTHLYTPNLWLGTERDLYRGLRRANGLLTCWTHYAPKSDHEAYSRTVPWLWLFEGFSGVSYFSTGGNFAILPSDMRTTHETRWWSAEVREIQRGIGEQLIRAKRDDGGIRVVYNPGATGISTWLRALNQLALRYRVIDRADLAAALDPSARLVILPDVRELSDQGLATLAKFVAGGGHVVATAASGILSAAPGPKADAVKLASGDRLAELFGVVRQALPETLAEWEKKSDLRRNVPCELRLAPGFQGVPDGLTGGSAGEAGVAATGADVALEFAALGQAKRGDGKAHPQFIQELFATPAATRKLHGPGVAWYLGFRPDLESVKAWLPVLARAAKAPELPENVTVEGKKDSTIYVYPFADGDLRFVGVIQDYWRMKPAQDLGDDSRVESVAYFNHGRQRWAEREAVLESTRAWHWYDVRRGRYLGQTDRVAFGLQPGRPELFARLPYQLRKLRLEAPPKARAGETLQVAVELVAEGEIGAHVVNLRLADPDGKTRGSWERNVHTRGGRGSAAFTLPYGAKPGRWRVSARDAATGVQSSAAIVVGPGEIAPSAPLPEDEVVVIREPVDWPAGNWLPFAEKEAVAGVQVKVSPLRRKRLRGRPPFTRQWHSTGSFSLKNALQNYGLLYQVCDDWKANRWEPGTAAAPYLPGLGFRKPKPHMWYYNGYIVVKLDDHNASRYVMTRMAEAPAGENGRVDVTWQTPRARIDLAFVMMPDHSGVFQQLTISPTEPVGTVTVGFRSYPLGFGSKDKGKLFQVTDVDKKRWSVTGNAVYDRAYGKGMGPGAILVLPEELTKVEFALAPRLTKTVARLKAANPPGAALLPPEKPAEMPLDVGLGLPEEDEQEETPKAPAAPPQAPIRLRWVLWMFPDLSNADAAAYLRANADDTRKRLLRLFP